MTFISPHRESINSLKRKYSQSSEPSDSDAAIERTLNEVAKEGCQFLLDEVFLDLEVGTLPKRNKLDKKLFGSSGLLLSCHQAAHPPTVFMLALTFPFL